MIAMATVLASAVIATPGSALTCSDIQDSESLIACQRNAEANAAARAQAIRWGHSVSVDRMDDKTVCIIERGSISESEIRIAITKAATVIMPTGDQYPRSEYEIRVDRLPARKGIDSITGATAAAVLAEMKSGKLAVTRFTDWPWNSYVTEEFPLAGIGEHIDACREAVRKASK